MVVLMACLWGTKMAVTTAVPMVFLKVFPMAVRMAGMTAFLMDFLMADV